MNEIFGHEHEGQSERLPHPTVGNACIEELIAFDDIFERAIELQCRHLGAQEHLLISATPSLELHTLHQCSADTPPAMRFQDGDALRFGHAISAITHSGSSYHFSADLRQEVEAFGIEPVDLFFLGDVLAHDEDLSSDLPGGFDLTWVLED